MTTQSDQVEQEKHFLAEYRVDPERLQAAGWTVADDREEVYLSPTGRYYMVGTTGFLEWHNKVLPDGSGAWRWKPKVFRVRPEIETRRVWRNW